MGRDNFGVPTIATKRFGKGRISDAPLEDMHPPIDMPITACNRSRGARR